MITDPRSSLTEELTGRNVSSLPGEMPLIKSVGAANRQSPPIPRKFVAFTTGTPRLGCVLTSSKINDSYYARMTCTLGRWSVE